MTRIGGPPVRVEAVVVLLGVALCVIRAAIGCELRRPRIDRSRARR